MTTACNQRPHYASAGWGWRWKVRVCTGPLRRPKFKHLMKKRSVTIGRSPTPGSVSMGTSSFILGHYLEIFTLAGDHGRVVPEPLAQPAGGNSYLHCLCVDSVFVDGVIRGVGHRCCSCRACAHSRSEAQTSRKRSLQSSEKREKQAAAKSLVKPVQAHISPLTINIPDTMLTISAPCLPTGSISAANSCSPSPPGGRRIFKVQNGPCETI